MSNSESCVSPDDAYVASCLTPARRQLFLARGSISVLCSTRSSVPCDLEGGCVVRPSSAVSFTLQVSKMFRRVAECVRHQGKANGRSIHCSYAFDSFLRITVSHSSLLKYNGNDHMSPALRLRSSALSPRFMYIIRMIQRFISLKVRSTDRSW